MADEERLLARQWDEYLAFRRQRREAAGGPAESPLGEEGVRFLFYAGALGTLRVIAHELSRKPPGRPDDVYALLERLGDECDALNAELRGGG
jgi:hypothetical protein